MKLETLELEVEAARLRIAALRRAGERPPILFLHGFGSSKEDFADIACHHRFDGRTVIAYDAPGCGGTPCRDPAIVSIPFLGATAEAVIGHYRLSKFHLVGHSMGGLTALLLACERSDAILSFTNIEGNLAPSDCFFSRQIIGHEQEDGDAFLNAFVSGVATSGKISHAFYAANLKTKVDSRLAAPIFRSMVALSDNADLLDKFTGLSCPKMFLYGDANRALPYLPVLRETAVDVREIAYSDHFPMYANPVAMWASIGDFIDRTDEGRTDV